MIPVAIEVAQKIPVPPGGKAPRLRGWQQIRMSPAEVQEHLARQGNIAIRLGRASGDLVDADLDCIEALELADYGDTPAAMMLIDRAVSAYQDFMRITG